MKDNHGFEKVNYVPQTKKELSRTDIKKMLDKFSTVAMVLLIVVIAVILFVYPGYFIKVFSETGYRFMR